MDGRFHFARSGSIEVAAGAERSRSSSTTWRPSGCSANGPGTSCKRLSASFGRVDAEQAIRTRRTHKAYGAEPVPRATLEELFELARWAPNHNLTNPWRFRVLGPEALARLREAA